MINSVLLLGFLGWVLGGEAKLAVLLLGFATGLAVLLLGNWPCCCWKCC